MHVPDVSSSPTLVWHWRLLCSCSLSFIFLTISRNKLFIVGPAHFVWQWCPLFFSGHHPHFNLPKMFSTTILAKDKPETCFYVLPLSKHAANISLKMKTHFTFPSQKWPKSLESVTSSCENISFQLFQHFQPSKSRSLYNSPSPKAPAADLPTGHSRQQDVITGGQIWPIKNRSNIKKVDLS